MKFGLQTVTVSTAAVEGVRRRSATSSLGRETTINVVSWVFLALVASTLITRLAVKLSRRTSKKVLQLDDGFLLLAAVSDII